jgi:hypothetical protein
VRPLQNAPFCPIPASGSNFNPQNTQCIPVVKIFAFLGLEPRLNIKNGFNWAGKIEHFSKVSVFRDQAQGPI